MRPRVSTSPCRDNQCHCVLWVRVCADVGRGKWTAWTIRFAHSFRNKWLIGRASAIQIILIGYPWTDWVALGRWIQMLEWNLYGGQCQPGALRYHKISSLTRPDFVSMDGVFHANGLLRRHLTDKKCATNASEWICYHRIGKHRQFVFIPYVYRR